MFASCLIQTGIMKLNEVSTSFLNFFFDRFRNVFSSFFARVVVILGNFYRLKKNGVSMERTPNPYMNVYSSSLFFYFNPVSTAFEKNLKGEYFTHVFDLIFRFLQSTLSI